MTGESEEGQGSPGASPAALGIALGNPLDPRAASYLEKSSRLVEMQIEDLRREDSIRHWSLRVRHIADVLKLTFQLGIAVLVLGAIAAIATVVWSASQEDGLVVEAFTVPPDFARQGLTGEVVAARFLDGLSDLQAQTTTSRAGFSYSRYARDDIKVEIPDTGVSIGEVYRYLSRLLGHQTAITGEVFQTAAGIAVTSRIGNDAGPTVRGKFADLDALLEKAAELVYARTQPDNFAAYLALHGRGGEAKAIFRTLIASGSEDERDGATLALGNAGYFPDEDLLANAPVVVAMTQRRPGLAVAWLYRSSNDLVLQHDEDFLASCLGTVRAFSGPVPSQWAAWSVPLYIAESRVAAAHMRGDDLGSRIAGGVHDAPHFAEVGEPRMELELLAFAALHDKAGFERLAAGLPPPKSTVYVNRRGFTIASARTAFGDYAGVLPVQRTFRQFDTMGTFYRAVSDRSGKPQFAKALLALGRLKEAEADIEGTPLDCDLCVRVRGATAAARHDWKSSARWYAVVSARSPSIPFADTDWGAMLLAKGDLDAAIAKFESATRKGPNFADPLEMWGEALIRKNRSDLALLRFEQAAARAPNWGRLHLKWGEALLWLGRRADAAEQVTLAGTLYLTPGEQAELQRVKAIL